MIKTTFQIDPFTRPVDITTMASNNPSQSDTAPPTSQDKTMLLQMIKMMRSLNARMKALEARTRPTTPVQQSQSVQQITRPMTQPITQPATQQIAQPITQESTQLATQPEQSEQQEHRENTAEKESIDSSDGKVITTKNTGLLSTIPRLAISLWFQQHSDTEDITAIWPVLPVHRCVSIWYITGLSIQEVDLLRRSQPNHHGELDHKISALITSI